MKFPEEMNINPIKEEFIGQDIRFSFIKAGKEIGSITANKISEQEYEIGGLFVDPAIRGEGIGTNLVKAVNGFLKRNNAKGILVNTIKGEASIIYERNGWLKSEFKSQGAYGGYEYVFDARLK